MCVRDSPRGIASLHGWRERADEAVGQVSQSAVVIRGGAGRGRETSNDALSWRQAVLQGGESAADHSLLCAADMASGLGHDVALSKSSAESWKRRIWSIRIDMLKSAGQHRAGYAASICRRPALRHGLIRELLIVVIPPSLLRANAESDPRARSALNSRIQEIISWVLLGERWAAFKRLLNTLTEPYRMSSRYTPSREESTSRSRIANTPAAASGKVYLHE